MRNFASHFETEENVHKIDDDEKRQLIFTRNHKFLFFPSKMTYHAVGKHKGEEREKKKWMKVIYRESMKSTWCKHKFHYIHFHCKKTSKNTCKDSINCHYWISTWKAFLFIDKIHSIWVIVLWKPLNMCFFWKAEYKCIKNIIDDEMSF